MLETWIDSIRLYERRKDSDGNRLSIQEDIKISVLEALVPAELEEHIQFNRDRFSNFEKSLREISHFMEIRHGHRMNVTSSAGTGRSHARNDDMGVGAFHAGGGKGCRGRKGKGSGKAVIGDCHNRGKPGHHTANCWAAGGGAASAGPKQQYPPKQHYPPKQPYRLKEDPKGKGSKGKGKGFKGNGNGGKGRKGMGKKGRHAGSL